ncbi:MAG: hypothetical protein V4596_13180 [Bdellovibrionota bacterium]
MSKIICFKTVITVACILSGSHFAKASICSSLFSNITQDHTFAAMTNVQTKSVLFSGTMNETTSEGQSIYLEMISVNSRKISVAILTGKGYSGASDFYLQSSTTDKVTGIATRKYIDSQYSELIIYENLRMNEKEFSLVSHAEAQETLRFNFTERESEAPKFEFEAIASFKGIAKRNLSDPEFTPVEVTKKGVDDYFIDVTIFGKTYELILEKTFSRSESDYGRMYVPLDNSGAVTLKAIEMNEKTSYVLKVKDNSYGSKGIEETYEFNTDQN